MTISLYFQKPLIIMIELQLIEYYSSMPRTICSDLSHLNLSVSNSQDYVRTGIKKKKKKIDKRKKLPQVKKNPMHQKRRNIIMNKKLCRKLVYSPEYIININEVSTPLYHSDQHQPSFEINDIGNRQPIKIHSYIDMDVLMKMYKEEHEEKVERELVSGIRAIQISEMEQEMPIQ